MDRGPRCIGDRLEDSRERRFVGRCAELELFRAAVAADAPPFAVLYVHGPGGIGKTALLREFSRLAVAADRPVCSLDARNIEASPPGFLRALRHALGRQGERAFDVTRDWPARGVLLLDTCELISSLDAWLRDVFLPQLPAQSAVVIAGRSSPPPQWRTDPAWAGLTRIVALRALAPRESCAYLAAQGVPAARVASIQALAHGHPLALAMIAEMVRIGALAEPLRLEQQPDTVHMLLQRLLEHVPGLAHRRALAVAAIARTTTEALLADVLGEEAAAMCFDWLRGLTFVEQGPYGIFPHDAVRELLEADWRWRNPQGYADLQDRVLAHLRRRFAQAPGAERQRLRQENMFVRRHDPGMEPYFAWDELGQAFAEPVTAVDEPAILDMVGRHQGQASAEIARYWLKRQPQAFQVFRTMDGKVCGFMANLELHEFRREDLAVDPALVAAKSFVDSHGSLAAGEVIVYLRFWMDRQAHQVPSPAVNLTAASSVACWLTSPRLRWNFIAIADPAFWEPHFSSINIQRHAAADFEVGGCRYGVFAHDWRAEPPAEWEKRRRSAAVPARAPPEQCSECRALSREEFDSALRQALRDCARPTLLAGNPLLDTALGKDPESGKASAAGLQLRLAETVALLKDSPKDRKLYLALWHTYFEPEATQERVAEKLNLPFSTYRYHLTRGVERIVVALWQRYCSGRTPR